jgi:hypothetical protein
MAEMVRRELDLVAVGAQDCWLRNDASVVHQDVEAIVFEPFYDVLLDCAKGGQVHPDETQRSRWVLGFDFGHQHLRSSDIAACEVNV